MIPVRVDNIDPNQTMEIVRELRAQGLVQGKDFDFAFHQRVSDFWTNGGAEAPEPNHAIFSFHTEKYATLFAIKHS